MKVESFYGLSFRQDLVDSSLSMNKGLLFQVYDSETCIQQAYLPRLIKDEKDLKKIEPLVFLLKTAWLYGTLVNKQRVSADECSKFTGEFLKFFQFYTTWYRLIMRDQGFHVDGNHLLDSEILDISTFPKLYSPKDFQSKKNLLSFSGGKESTVCEMVLKCLKIPFDYFLVYYQPVGQIKDFYEIEYLNSDFNCFLTDPRRMGYFTNLVHLYEKLDSKLSYIDQVNETLPLGWMSTISRQILTLIYAKIYDYQNLFVGSEMDLHQAFRTQTGWSLASPSSNSQFINNYLTRSCGLDTKITSPITNFSQGACIQILMNNDKKFISCFQAKTPNDMPCNKCPKCQRLEYLSKFIQENSIKPTGFHFEDYYGHNKDFEFTYKMNKDDNYREIFPGIRQHGFKTKYFTHLYSSSIVDVWDMDTLAEIGKHFNMGICVDTVLSGLWRHRENV